MQPFRDLLVWPVLESPHHKRRAYLERQRAHPLGDERRAPDAGGDRLRRALPRHRVPRGGGLAFVDLVQRPGLEPPAPPTLKRLGDRDPTQPCERYAIVIKLRDAQVANRPVYAAIGVNMDGERDVLGLWLGPTVTMDAKRWFNGKMAVVTGGASGVGRALGVPLGAWVATSC